MPRAQQGRIVEYAPFRMETCFIYSVYARTSIVYTAEITYFVFSGLQTNIDTSSLLYRVHVVETL